MLGRKVFLALHVPLTQSACQSLDKWAFLNGAGSKNGYLRSPDGGGITAA